MDVLLDTNILLRLVDRNDPAHVTIRAAVRIIKARGDKLVVATQNLAEFWNVCTRPASARGGFGLLIADAGKRLRLLERIVRILPDTPAAYPIWKDLIITLGVIGVQVHDSRLVALMKVNNVSHILTLNGPDFARYAGLVVLNPATLISPGQ